MAEIFVGPVAAGLADGTSWANRYGALNDAEDQPVAAGDDVIVGPGVYREQLTLDVSGGNVYAVGTVTVTNGSATVTGAGTAFVANVLVADMFHNRIFASAADGVANGTATFTSATGTFQAAMIGQVVQIMTRGAYIIDAVAAVNSITLADPNGLGWPGAAVGLTYSVMSGQGPYEIESITDNTNLELVRPWCGPTVTGMVYLTYTPIRYIGDETGEHTDGVGGEVRITGSDNDQTQARTRCVWAGNVDYRLFRGFRFDMASTGSIYLTTICNYLTVEDCKFHDNERGIHDIDSRVGLTVRRCIFEGQNQQDINFSDGITQDDSGHVIESCLFIGGYASFLRSISVSRIGGITVRNCVFQGPFNSVRVGVALAVGQAVSVWNSVFIQGNQVCVAAVLGELIENFNTFWNNATDRVNTAVGASSQVYPPMFASPILFSGEGRISGIKFLGTVGELSEWSPIRAIAGFDEPGQDLYGIQRPPNSAQNSWGPVQYSDMERETGTVRTGNASMALHDAGRFQMWREAENVATTISVYVYREANYAGGNPQMIVKQPGQPDDITTDAGAAGGWNLLTTTLTPAALPPYVIVELISRNTAAALAYNVFWDDLVVS